MSSKFTAGDLVVLKSGGPALTIREISSNECNCVWFIAGELKSAWFDDATIEPKKAKKLGVSSG